MSTTRTISEKASKQAKSIGATKTTRPDVQPISRRRRVGRGSNGSRHGLHVVGQ